MQLAELAKNNFIPINEQFVSFQGEGVNLGKPYFFIRTDGCPLRCNFCDSEYTWHRSDESIKPIYEVVGYATAVCQKHSIEWVSITGGEPLLYPQQLELMLRAFEEYNLKTHVETSGRLYSREVHKLCDIYSVDAKTPCTGETMDGFFKGMNAMRRSDQVKCLILDDKDFDYANQCNRELDGRCTMVLQPFNTEILTESTQNMPEAMRSHRRMHEAATVAELRRRLTIAFKEMFKKFTSRCEAGEIWKNVVLTPQLHVLCFGNTPGT